MAPASAERALERLELSEEEDTRAILLELVAELALKGERYAHVAVPGHPRPLVFDPLSGLSLVDHLERKRDLGCLTCPPMSGRRRFEFRVRDIDGRDWGPFGSSCFFKKILQRKPTVAANMAGRLASLGANHLHRRRHEDVRRRAGTDARGYLRLLRLQWALYAYDSRDADLPGWASRAIASVLRSGDILGRPQFERLETLSTEAWAKRLAVFEGRGPRPGDTEALAAARRAMDALEAMNRHAEPEAAPLDNLEIRVAEARATATPLQPWDWFLYLQARGVWRAYLRWGELTSNLRGSALQDLRDLERRHSTRVPFTEAQEAALWLAQQSAAAAAAERTRETFAAELERQRAQHAVRLITEERSMREFFLSDGITLMRRAFGLRDSFVLAGSPELDDPEDRHDEEPGVRPPPLEALQEPDATTGPARPERARGGRDGWTEGARRPNPRAHGHVKEANVREPLVASGAESVEPAILELPAAPTGRFIHLLRAGLSRLGLDAALKKLTRQPDDGVRFVQIALAAELESFLADGKASLGEDVVRRAASRLFSW